MKRTIYVRWKNEELRLAWFPGTSDSALRDTLKETLHLPPDSNVILRDDNGVIYAINQHLPDELHLIAEQRAPDNSSLLEDPKNPTSATSANSFRGELLKFERINAHLANERTWLAWVRTALSTLSCAFAFLSLSNSGYYEIMVYVLGSIFCLSVIFVYVTGWLRYSRVKLILGLSFNEMKSKFDRIGIHWVAWVFGGLFVSTSILYWTGVFMDIRKGDK